MSFWGERSLAGWEIFLGKHWYCGCKGEIKNEKINTIRARRMRAWKLHEKLRRASADSIFESSKLSFISIWQLLFVFRFEIWSYVRLTAPSIPLVRLVDRLTAAHSCSFIEFSRNNKQHTAHQRGLLSQNAFSVDQRNLSNLHELNYCALSWSSPKYK